MCELPWASSSLILSMMTEYLGTLLLVTIPRLYIFSNPTLANNDASMRIRGFITGQLSQQVKDRTPQCRLEGS